MDALIDPGYCLFDSHTMARNVRPIAVAGDEAQWRPCRIETGPLNDSADWMEHCRGIWEQRFDRLDDYLRELEEEEKTGGRKRIGILVKEPSDREIVTTRVFDAPREFVFKAWTDPVHLAHWWGPKGFTNTFHEFDLRPGGVWLFVMPGPDGVDYQNESVFVEIVKPEWIVFQHVSGPQFQVTATFENLGGRTKLTFRMLFESAAECDKVKVFAVEGNEQNFDRREGQLGRMA